MSDKIVLGRGLEALIPSRKETEESVEDSQYRKIQLDKIKPNPMQPRKDFDESGLRELAESFKAQGILQPILVRRNNDHYILIAGERRYRAAHLAELTEIPAILIEDTDERMMLEMALVENIQREDLNPLEAAEAFRRLLDDGALTQNQVAAKVGRSRAAVANSLRLLSLPDKIKDLLRSGKLTEGHARAILSVDNAVSQVKLAERIVRENLSVRRTEESARRARPRKLIPRKKIPAIVEAENYLKQLMGTSVKINNGLKKGKIEIEYYGDDDLERILELFRNIH